LLPPFKPPDEQTEFSPEPPLGGQKPDENGLVFVEGFHLLGDEPLQSGMTIAAEDDDAAGMGEIPLRVDVVAGQIVFCPALGAVFVFH
jgi:hypothetical protein